MTTTGRLEVHGITKRFGKAVVLDGINLSVAPGRRHGLIGVNGAGKTTLFNVIAGDLAAEAGTVHLDGEPLHNLSMQARVLRGLGRTYQISSLAMELTVRANLALSQGSGRIPSMLRPWRARADDPHVLAVAAEFGIEAELDRPAAELSHGSMRQLEIAMILSRRPRVLLLDEPAAGLSPAERGTLISSIKSLPSDVTVLLIEHDMDVVMELCDWITVLHNGEVLAEGTPGEMAADEQVRAAYLGGL